MQDNSSDQQSGGADPPGFFSRLFGDWGIARFAVFFTLLGMALIMGRMSIHYWESYQIDGDGKAILVGFGFAFAMLEMWMLALRAELVRKGHKKLVRVWTFAFVCVVAINIATDTGAIVALTSSDTAHRAQELRNYEFQQNEASELRDQIRQLPLAITDPSLRIPSIALQPRIDEMQQRVAQAEGRGQGVPSSVLRRSSELQSAIAIMQRVEALQSELDALEPTIEQTPPEATLMQFQVLSDLSAMAGVTIPATKVPMILGLAMIFVAHFAVNLGLAIVTGHAGASPDPGRMPWVDVTRWPYMRKASEAAQSLLQRWRTRNDGAQTPPHSPQPSPSAPPPRARPRPSRRDDVHRDFDDFDS